MAGQLASHGAASWRFSGLGRLAVSFAAGRAWAQLWQQGHFSRHTADATGPSFCRLCRLSASEDAVHLLDVCESGRSGVAAEYAAEVI